MPPTSQSEIRMFPFKLRDSATRVYVTKQHGCARTLGCKKLEEKDLMNAVGNPFIYFSILRFLDEITCLRKNSES